MNEADVIDIIRAGFRAALIMAGPPLAGALAAGLAVGILQTLTQVQEMTLVNIPKIVVTLVLVLLFLPLSFSALQSYMEAIVQLIVGV
jgi:flagellar biosynthesis protein FliQ